MRLGLALRRRRSGATLDFYVDSANGEDANTGEKTEPFQTLGGVTWAADLSVGLVGDSSWGEEILANFSGVKIQGVSLGALPIISAYDTVTAWTQPDAGGAPNVWSKDIDHAVTVAPSRIIVMEDGAILEPRQTSRANVNSNAGTRRGVHDGSLPSNDPATVEIHTTDSASPNSNGKTYEATTRDQGILVGNDAQIERLELRGAANNNGAISAGTGAALKKLVLRDCGKHHLYMNSGTAEDCIAIIGDEPITGDGGATSFVAYSLDATGFSATMRRCFALRGEAVTQLAAARSVTGQFCHSAGGNYYDAVTFEQCATIDLLSASAISCDDVIDMTIQGCYTRSDDKAIEVGLNTQTCNIHHNQINLCQRNHMQLTPVEACDFDIRHNTASTFTFTPSRNFINANANATCTVEYNTFYARASFWFAGTFAGQTTHRYNLYIFNDSDTRNILTLPSGAASDYNVYVNIGAGSLQYTYNSVTYTGLSAYQSGSGQEANSLEFTSATLSDVLSGDPATGDFRINAAGTVGAQIAALGAGAQEHWDWNARAVASGPATAWPDVPETLGEARTYALNPGAWTF